MVFNRTVNSTGQKTKVSYVGMSLKSLCDIPFEYTVRAEALYVSENNLLDLEGLARFSGLKTLSAADNCIKYLHNIDYLEYCEDLINLSLSDNLVAKMPFFSEYVLHYCPHLRVLNGVKLEQINNFIPFVTVQCYFDQLCSNEIRLSIILHWKYLHKVHTELLEQIRGRFRWIRAGHVPADGIVPGISVSISKLLFVAYNSGVYLRLQSQCKPHFFALIQDLCFRKSYLTVIEMKASKSTKTKIVPYSSDYWVRIVSEILADQQQYIAEVIGECIPDRVDENNVSDSLAIMQQIVVSPTNRDRAETVDMVMLDRAIASAPVLLKSSTEKSKTISANVKTIAAGKRPDVSVKPGQAVSGSDISKISANYDLLLQRKSVSSLELFDVAPPPPPLQELSPVVITNKKVKPERVSAVVSAVEVPIAVTVPPPRSPKEAKSTPKNFEEIDSSDDMLGIIGNFLAHKKQGQTNNSTSSVRGIAMDSEEEYINVVRDINKQSANTLDDSEGDRSDDSIELQEPVFLDGIENLVNEIWSISDDEISKLINCTTECAQLRSEKYDAANVSYIVEHSRKIHGLNDMNEIRKEIANIYNLLYHSEAAEEYFRINERRNQILQIFNEIHNKELLKLSKANGFVGSREQGNDQIRYAILSDQELLESSRSKTIQIEESKQNLRRAKEKKAFVLSEIEKSKSACTELEIQRQMLLAKLQEVVGDMSSMSKELKDSQNSELKELLFEQRAEELARNHCTQAGSMVRKHRSTLSFAVFYMMQRYLYYWRIECRRLRRIRKFTVHSINRNREVLLRTCFLCLFLNKKKEANLRLATAWVKRGRKERFLINWYITSVYERRIREFRRKKDLIILNGCWYAWSMFVKIKSRTNEDEHQLLLLARCFSVIKIFRRWKNWARRNAKSWDHFDYPLTLPQTNNIVKCGKLKVRRVFGVWKRSTVGLVHKSTLEKVDLCCRTIGSKFLKEAVFNHWMLLLTLNLHVKQHSIRRNLRIWVRNLQRIRHFVNLDISAVNFRQKSLRKKGLRQWLSLVMRKKRVVVAQMRLKSRLILKKLSVCWVKWIKLFNFSRKETRYLSLSSETYYKNLLKRVVGAWRTYTLSVLVNKAKDLRMELQDQFERKLWLEQHDTSTLKLLRSKETSHLFQSSIDTHSSQNYISEIRDEPSVLNVSDIITMASSRACQRYDSDESDDEEEVSDIIVSRSLKKWSIRAKNRTRLRNLFNRVTNKNILWMKKRNFKIWHSFWLVELWGIVRAKKFSLTTKVAARSKSIPIAAEVENVEKSISEMKVSIGTLRGNLSDKQIEFDKLVLECTEHQSDVDKLQCEQLENDILINRLRVKLSDINNESETLESENKAIIVMCKGSQYVGSDSTVLFDKNGRFDVSVFVENYTNREIELQKERAAIMDSLYADRSSLYAQMETRYGQLVLKQNRNVEELRRIIGLKNVEVEKQKYVCEEIHALNSEIEVIEKDLSEGRKALAEAAVQLQFAYDHFKARTAESQKLLSELNDSEITLTKALQDRSKLIDDLKIELAIIKEEILKASSNTVENEAAVDMFGVMLKAKLKSEMATSTLQLNEIQLRKNNFLSKNISDPKGGDYFNEEKPIGARSSGPVVIPKSGLTLKTPAPVKTVSERLTRVSPAITQREVRLAKKPKSSKTAENSGTRKLSSKASPTHKVPVSPIETVKNEEEDDDSSDILLQGKRLAEKIRQRLQESSV